jgi:hypothetical protein
MRLDEQFEILLRRKFRRPFVDPKSLAQERVDNALFQFEHGLKFKFNPYDQTQYKWGIPFEGPDIPEIGLVGSHLSFDKSHPS